MNFITLTRREVIPITQNLIYKLVSCPVPFSSVCQIADFALDAIAVLAQDSTDCSRPVVVVKASHHSFQINFANPAQAVLLSD